MDLLTTSSKIDSSMTNNPFDTMDLLAAASKAIEEANQLGSLLMSEAPFERAPVVATTSSSYQPPSLKKCVPSREPLASVPKGYGVTPNRLPHKAAPKESPAIWNITVKAPASGRTKKQVKRNVRAPRSSNENQLPAVSRPSPKYGHPDPDGSRNILEPTDPLDDVDEEEEFAVGETFEEYRPKKLEFGAPHPDPVVETASLASVDPMPITYKLSLDSSVIENGCLSALQLESISYACQSHERFFRDKTRAGFLIGDGAGVGKGRTIAGIILENFLQGRRKAIWFSVSTDLLYDAERDLRDINAAHIPVMGLQKIPYGRIESTFREGVIFSTYTALIGKSKTARGSYRSRLDQLVQWCGKDFDGCIVFDESHKAKNLSVAPNAKSTKTGQAVLALQLQLPKARIVYASATGASETRNLAYMVRLGLWGPGTPFRDFPSFYMAVENQGISVMEIVAMDLKQRGMYIARQLSFSGVTFRNEEIQITGELEGIYNECTQLWTEAWTKFNEAAEMIGLDSKEWKIVSGQFWSTHQRCFRYLCMAAKIDRVVELAKAAVEAGQCVVIGLQSTGEARTLAELDREPLTDFVSGAKAVMEALTINHFPLPHGAIREVIRKRRGSPLRSNSKYPRGTLSDHDYHGCIVSDTDSDDNLTIRELINASAIKRYQSENTRSAAFKMRDELLAKIESMSDKFPKNMLDELIHKLGGPQAVAEMTGRKGRMVQDHLGVVEYELRAEIDVPTEKLNLVEKDRFMSGEKLIAIISEAASSGISLQSDKRVLNTRPRLHITLELPWSADRAIQQFGRTHRSNQVHPPQYVFVISNLGGERRFASTVAKRLESLGALTHGDRRATETQDLTSFNMDTKYGRRAVRSVLRAVEQFEDPLVPFPKNYPGDFCSDVLVALKEVGLKDWMVSPDNGNESRGRNHKILPKFLNRLMGMKVPIQNALFAYFTSTLDAIVTGEKRRGNYDFGIKDLGSRGEDVTLDIVNTYNVAHATGSASIKVTTVKADRGLAWEEVQKKLSEKTDRHSAVYRSLKSECVSLIIHVIGNTYQEYRPNLGQTSTHTLAEIHTKFSKLGLPQAEKDWRYQHKFALTRCSDEFAGKTCKNQSCLRGMRQVSHTIVSGCLMSAWYTLNAVIQHQVEMMRIKTSDGQKLIGILIKNKYVDKLRSKLEEKEHELGQQGAVELSADDEFKYSLVH